MYQVSIFNAGKETIIHTPNSDKKAPHLLSMPFKEGLSQAEQLSFIIPYNNPGYELIRGLTTKVKVYDTRDDSVIFSGRVTPTSDGMGSDGKFVNKVTCEGAMNYLIDTQTRNWDFVNQIPQQILQFLLDRHNEKMDDERKIYLGTIEVIQPITISTNYESTLNAIINKIRNILGGDLRVKERNGLLYLDYLNQQGRNNGAEIRLRRNLKEILRDYDPTDVITRGIPLGYGEGINQLNITSVNNGIEYIEDQIGISNYGVIEGVLTNKDIQDANTLKIYGQTALSERRQAKLSYSQKALDLSVLPGHENEKYDLGDTLHTIVDVMDIDVLTRVVERDRDLILSPWDPDLTLSTRMTTLSDDIVDLKQRSQTLENAPQGSTYIDTYGYPDNIDKTHNFQLPVWVSPDIINVNRVRLHIDGQKYRAYEKSITGGASNKSTTTEGGDDVVSQTVTSWGDPRSEDDSMPAPNTLFPINAQPGFASETGRYLYDYEANGMDISYAAAKYVYAYGMQDTPLVDLYLLQHVHKMQLKAHNHGMDHGHDNKLDYGIYEDTYPVDVYVKINGQNVAGPFGTKDANGVAQPFSVDIDLTPYISKPGQTYNLEVTSSQNGRVNCWVSIQAFIQSK